MANCVDCERYIPNNYDFPEMGGRCEETGDRVKGKQLACEGFEAN